MEIRPATSQDTEAIVALLKASLGEGLMPKSVEYWNWKHINNPFGRSPVLLALQQGEMVGVRAFMRWTWQLNGQQIKAVRAVDTATHPGFQGKGIFSTLTKALLQHCHEEQIGYVFNTPNGKSMPGYLKMGWVRAGRLPVRITVRRPFTMGLGLLNKPVPKTVNVPSSKPEIEVLKHPRLEQLIADNQKLFSGNQTTSHSIASLVWRYQAVPVEEYFAESIEANGRLRGIVFYRLKDTKYGLEMRITDTLLQDEAAAKQLKTLIKAVAASRKADFVTTEGLSNFNLLGGLNFRRPIGPIVTVRKLNAEGIRPWET
jgi:N-acetylglutamate synthase-like GNAT family acetyltransferase